MTQFSIRARSIGWETVLLHNNKRLREEHVIVGHGKTRKNEYSFIEDMTLPDSLIDKIEEIQGLLFAITEEIKEIDDGRKHSKKTLLYDEKFNIHMSDIKNKKQQS